MWQKMDTAPKDGSNIFLAVKGEREGEPPWKFFVGSYRPKRSEWAMFWTNATIHPSHWRPLPAPPTD